MYAPPFPPDGFNVIIPSLYELQLILVIVGLNIISSGSLTIAESRTGQPAIVTITLYVPGLRFEMLSDVDPLSQRKLAR